MDWISHSARYCWEVGTTFPGSYLCWREQETARGAQPDPDATNFWAVYPGWDMGDPTTITEATSGITEDACLEACSASATCVSYSYDPYPSGSCWLKDALTFSDIEARTTPFTLGILGTCQSTSTVFLIQVKLTNDFKRLFQLPAHGKEAASPLEMTHQRDDRAH
ncbi:hypothetical protein C8F04DRAFT_1194546 [Mycena alexandri]|uniref:Apple domain-containing protein n=1 Tax=Mycena alexandri TaxID=1745969 RepID=A0AAD6S838_9AGAR|nr:hypothetical protein C8F04DRAFT_1194546 [Mycena alexandri]